MRITKTGLLLALMGAGIGVAHAAATAYPSALSARLVRFVYDPNQTYTIYTRPGMVTDIRIPEGSQLVGLVLGNTVQWITSGLGNSNNVFIKPVAPGLETSATLVTTKRTYQLMMVSRAKGPWYQQVKFNPSSSIALYNPQAAMSVASTPAKHTPKKPAPSTKNAFSNIPLSQMNFDWHVQGQAKFAPSKVFSTSNFVWMDIPSNAPAPVVFSRDTANAPWHIVNYNTKGSWIVVQGTPAQIRLLANGHQVVVSQGAQASNTSNAGQNNNDVFNPFGNRSHH
ncbi:TrbG/VirB9 family P-type conjugative transfer protein [Acidihalobacter ferrooxydans]|uniref:P-type conjugative transfer protein VirB9 n=1 Tax=Acidihalobacter ferrooxydans TaxID=1765967 RepID=A0A1P8UFC5_9GAMM|nr:TrbG/VirB9 family P-type conjugative transfer protein [Acidihalobacter ferrooxydans]APZ42547.1 hypothetical protein BW247_05105 [Acidihalobacter ferrooxydans]